jgi:hypothetical protein
MKCAEIARQLGTSKTYISDTLNSAVQKCYNYIIWTFDLSHWEAFVFLVRWLDTVGSIEMCEKEIKSLLGRLSKDAQKAITIDRNKKSITETIEKVDNTLKGVSNVGI